MFAGLRKIPHLLFTVVRDWVGIEVKLATLLEVTTLNPLTEILADSYLRNNKEKQLGRYYFMGFHQYDFFAEALFGSGFKGIFDRVFGDSVSVRLALISKDDTSRGEETDNVFFSKPYKFASNEIYSRWLHGEHLRLSLNNKLVLAIAENNLDSAQTYLVFSVIS